MIFSLILGGRGGGGKRCTIEDENNNEGSFWLEVKREFSICDWFFTSRFSLKFNIDKIYPQTPEHQLYFGMACQVA